MLLLTFFSNTIMNYSLPEVATEYVQSGSITEKVRGTGTIEATDPYNVSIGESRVISSVAVKEGDEVKKGEYGTSGSGKRTKFSDAGLSAGSDYRDYDSRDSQQH